MSLDLNVACPFCAAPKGVSCRSRAGVIYPESQVHAERRWQREDADITAKLAARKEAPHGD